MKRILSLVLNLTMLATLLPVSAVNVQAAGGLRPPVMPKRVEIDIGDYVEMGEYYGKPIKWRCVDIDAKNGPLMLSDKTLCIKPFDASGEVTEVAAGNNSHSRDLKRKEDGSNYWADSNLRSWLNSDAPAGDVEWLCGNPPDDDHVTGGSNNYEKEAGFLTNFTQDELKAVKEVEQECILFYTDAEKNTNPQGTEKYTFKDETSRSTIEDLLTNYNENVYTENVKDRMFVLDVKQLYQVYKNSNKLDDYSGNVSWAGKKIPYYNGLTTPECINNAEYVDYGWATDAGAYFWLRTPSCVLFKGSNPEYGYGTSEIVVYQGGSIGGHAVDARNIGVRPAFYMDVDKINLKVGSGTETDPYSTRRIPFSGEENNIELSAAYGQGITADLSEYMSYKDDSKTTAGAFTYTIESDDDKTGASILGDVLTIPQELKAGEYTLTVKATEKKPLYSTVSLTNYDTKPVTLTISVKIEKADSTTTISGRDVTYGDTLALSAEISKTPLNSIALTADENKVNFYLGNELLGSADVSYSDENKDSGTATLEITAGKTFEIGSNIVTAQYGGSVNLNESGSNSITVNMAKKPLTYTTSAEDKVYNGSAEVDVVLTPTNIGKDNVTLTAKGEVSSANADSYDIVKLTDITISGEDGKYYSIESESPEAELSDPVVISKAQPTVTSAPAAKSLTYTGNSQELVTSGEVTGGKLQYSLDNITYSEDIPTGTKAGEYTVWYKTVGDENHNDTEPQSIAVTIVKSGSTTVITGGDVTYGDTLNLSAKISKTPLNSIALTAAEDKVSFYLGNELLGSADVIYTDENKDSGTAALEIPADKKFEIGPNTVTAQYGGSINLNESGSNSINVNMAPRLLTYTTSAEDKVYDGNAEVSVVLTPTNTGEDNVALTAKGEVSSANADSYDTVNLTEITISGDDSKYYSVESESPETQLSDPVEISKAQPTVTSAPAAKSLTYTGNSQELVTSGEVTGGKLEYSLDNTAYSEDIPTGSEVGIYNVWYRVIGDENHTDIPAVSVMSEIVKAESVVVVDGSEVTYGDKLVLNAEVSMADTSEISLAAADIVDFYLNGSPLGSAEVTYDNESADSGMATLEITADKSFEVGSNTITAEYGGSISLNGSTSGSVELTMDPKPLVYTVSAQDKEYDGTADIDVVLTPVNADGDDVTLTAKAALPSSEIGSYSGVSLSEITIGGSDAEYYTTDESADSAAFENAVEIKKAEGRASVSMGNYKCGETGVDPVSSSDTNEGAAEYFYKEKDADDSTYVSVKPLKAGKYTVKAVFAGTTHYNEAVAEADFEVTHDFSADYKTDDQNHWRECVCGEKSENAPHNIVIDEGKEPTCTESGITEGSHCDVCGYVTKAQTELAPLGHSFGSWTITSEPTQGLAGTAERVCSNNSEHKETKEVPPLSDSSWTKGEYKAPTETEDGYQKFTSEEFGEFTQTLPKLEKAETPKSSSTSSGGGSYNIGAAKNTPQTSTDVQPEGENAPQTSHEGENAPQKAESDKLPFTDVDSDNWFYGSVMNMYEKGIMSGMSQREFAPNSNITRGMFVTALYQLDGKPETNGVYSFDDVSDNAYYADAVAWASSNGIVMGYSDNEFAPDEPISREQAAAIIFRYAGYKGTVPEGQWASRIDYTDLSEISPWASESIMFCTTENIMVGRSNNTFDPKANITRAECASVLERYINKA